MFAPFIVFLVIYNQRTRAFYYVMVLTAMLFIMNVLKLSYHDPRPFWVDP